MKAPEGVPERRAIHEALRFLSQLLQATDPLPGSILANPQPCRFGQQSDCPEKRAATFSMRIIFKACHRLPFDREKENLPVFNVSGRPDNRGILSLHGSSAEAPAAPGKAPGVCPVWLASRSRVPKTLFLMPLHPFRKLSREFIFTLLKNHAGREDLAGSKNVLTLLMNYRMDFGRDLRRPLNILRSVNMLRFRIEILLFQGRSMPSFLSRNRSVLGWMLRRAAAPPGPLTFQRVCFRTFRMCSRSIAARSIGGSSFA